jgi:hypothetical protein
MTLRALIWLPLAASLAAQPAGPRVLSTSFQTGIADTFQLLLGGTFGEGPAWQNRVTSSISNMFHAGDALSVYASDSFDTRCYRNNWQFGLGYKRPVFRKGSHLVTIGTGVQRWLFPMVKSGSNDWILPGNVTYSTKVRRFSFSATGDSLTLLKSTLPTGSLVHTQGWVQYSILDRERIKVSFRNGPAHTYSWDFWGANGSRIIRYQTMVSITTRAFTIEGGYRKQWGLQAGICDNNYWQFALIRTFSRRIR